MSRVLPDETGFAAALDALRKDAVIAYPTETVYGLGVNPFSEAALSTLFRVKERDLNHPVLLIIDHLTQIKKYVTHISAPASRCLEKFWPGPLSLVLPAVPGLPSCLLDKNGHICVRCPDHPVARELCRLWGGPLTSTSANLSGKPPAQCARDAALPGVALVMDAGVLHPMPPSTVFDPEAKTVLREGPITVEMLKEVMAIS
jgi:L-threonylcarbamoyladenylate synthase